MGCQATDYSYIVCSTGHKSNKIIHEAALCGHGVVWSPAFSIELPTLFIIVYYRESKEWQVFWATHVVSVNMFHTCRCVVTYLTTCGQ